MNYTTIDHDARMKYGLSCNDYCVADKIYHLANNPENPSRWCYASRKKLAAMFGFSERAVFNIIDTLVEIGLAEIHPATKHVRTTQLWYSEFVNVPYAESAEPMKKVQSSAYAKSAEQGMQKVQSGYAKSADYNKNIEEELNKDDDDDARTREDEKKEPLPDVKKTRSQTEAYKTKEAKMHEWAARAKSPGQLMDLVRKTHKLNETQYAWLIEAYLEKQLANAKEHADETDFRQHFQHWIPKYLKSDEFKGLISPNTQGPPKMKHIR